MRGKGLNTIHSISLCNQREWQEWKNLTIPATLTVKWVKLRQLLKWAAPISYDEEDDFLWDPSGGKYTIKTRYKILQDQPNQQDWCLWKTVSKSESLPKIKIFIWTILKGNILTSENLKKKRLPRSSRCPMCLQAEETIQHLFQDCTLAKECWQQLRSPLEINLNFTNPLLEFLQV